MNPTVISYGVYYPWAFRMADPKLLPLVGKFVHLLSKKRLQLSALLQLRCDASLAQTLDAAELPECRDGSCRMPALAQVRAQTQTLKS